MSAELAAGAGPAAAFASQSGCGLSEAPGPFELAAMIVSNLADESERDMIDRAEAELLNYPAVTCPLVHTFTPGLYMRQILMPAGTMLTSRVHKTTHIFIILKGEISVVSGAENVTYRAPHIGITESGTRRVLYAHSDTVWATIHANPNEISDPDEMVEWLTDDAGNPLLAGISDPRLETWRSNYSESVCLSFTGKPELIKP